MTPANFIRGFIEAHEGGLSLDPIDRGNWHHGHLVGSKYGVTGDTLAAYRGVPAVTAQDMAALTLDEAVSVGLKLYYQVPRLSLLAWNRCTASVLDMCWGAGPVQGVKLLQRLIGATPDGQCGPATQRAYAMWIYVVGEEAAARAYATARDAFYDLIVSQHPANGKYLRGWKGRTASFLPGTAWWADWKAAA